MELYNLEKKSDSTRGRKSLDMKHDPSMLNGLANSKTSSEEDLQPSPADGAAKADATQRHEQSVRYEYVTFW